MSNWAAMMSKLGGGRGGASPGGGNDGRGGGGHGKGGVGKGGRGKGGTSGQIRGDSRQSRPSGGGGGGGGNGNARSEVAIAHAKPTASVRTSHPPPMYDGAEIPAMLEPGMPHYDECLRKCYRGLVLEEASAADGLSTTIINRVGAALEALRGRGFFHHDVVLAPQRGKQVPTPTVVRRILVGDPGITYKYLGLRTFAHPWSGDGCSREMGVLQQLNEELTARTRRLLSRGEGAGSDGRCDFNLTLINLLMPEEARGGALRNKTGVRLGGQAEQAVSWHADSSLVDFSSIAGNHIATVSQPHRSRIATI